MPGFGRRHGTDLWSVAELALAAAGIRLISAAGGRVEPPGMKPQPVVGVDQGGHSNGVLSASFSVALRPWR